MHFPCPGQLIPRDLITLNMLGAEPDYEVLHRVIFSLLFLLSLYISIYLTMAMQPFVGTWPLFEFLDLFTHSVRLLGWGISPLRKAMTTYGALEL
jgi:antibiotic biosynthesis monooxygenase (ABM) superfamily enzyme